MKHIIISIDGPAGSGKTTIAEILSKKLKIMYLNTGALYRALGLKCKMLNLNPENETDSQKVIDCSTINLKYVEGKQRVILDNVDVTDKLYNDLISDYASKISKHQIVRDFLLSLQRKTAEQQSVIMDGRDIGSVVFPNATHKFYLDADVAVRAERRFKDLVKQDPQITYDKILEDMIKRDFNDKNRKNSPLIVPKNAIVVDSTNNTIDEVIEKFLSIIKEK